MPHLVFHSCHHHHPPIPPPPPLLSHPHPPFLRTQNPTAWIHSARPMGLLSLQPRIGSTVRCMANPRRVKMVAKQIRRELSDMLLTDKVLQYAILPEASLGADRYLSSLTTISDVEVSGDLQVLHACFPFVFFSGYSLNLSFKFLWVVIKFGFLGYSCGSLSCQVLIFIVRIVYICGFANK